MQVSIETVSGLERRLTVGIPAEQIDSAVDKRLKEVAQKVRIDGFRPGKVPMREVKRRYGSSVRDEVMGEVMRNSYYEAIVQEKVQPAGYPSMEVTKNESGQDLEFTATFEVYPEVELQAFDGIKIERFTSEVNDADVDQMVETLRKQRAEFKDSERAAEDGDHVEIDYEGTKDGEAFEGGTASGTRLILGSGRMIPGFEEGLVGAKAGEERVLDLTFPEDYQSEELKGQAVQFKITVNKVFDMVLPEIDDEFIASFGTKAGGLDAFKADIRKNMERELKQALKDKVKNQVMDALLDLHTVEVPKALLANEIDRQRQGMMQQFGGGQQIDKSILPDELFSEQASRSVRLGLILGEILKKEEMKADADRVRALVEDIASSYEDPEEVINYYYGQQEQLQQIEGVVLEDQVVDKILADASVEESSIAYEDAVKKDA